MSFKAACGLQFKAMPSEGVVEGYGATWDLDLGGDRYEKGAFRDVIAEQLPANRVKIYREHQVAIGLPEELKEDSTGLWVRAKIEPGDTQDGDETLRLAARKVYDAFSVAYAVDPTRTRYTTEKGQRVRVIGRVTSLPHIGILADPMNPQAKIEAVKGQLPLVDLEKKGLFALAEALHHYAIAEDIRRWGELSDEEADLARQVLEQMNAAADEIKSRLPKRPADLSGLLDAARQLKTLHSEGTIKWQSPKN